MAKRDPSDSEGEQSDTLDNSSSDEAEPENPSDGDGQKNRGLSEYEKQRLARIAENRARMEALGLHKIAPTLMGTAPKSRKSTGKTKVVEEDEDYRPNDGEDHDTDDDDDDDDDNDKAFVGGKSASGSRRKKVKNKTPKSKKKVADQKQFCSPDYVDDDDDELMRAIALSLQDSAEGSGAGYSGLSHLSGAHGVADTVNERKGDSYVQENKGRGKRKKSFSSRVKMTEDELLIHFFQFDEAGRGSISIRDLHRVATAHDFLWTDKELADMIHYFDSDGDGKLNLDDFGKIVSRCNMLQDSENS